mmetsp:Transcript_62402/g.165610  ORF Transcript_62402/g.165610 Transcript_62402/m.165610 type:complete len:81 (+) Transcript_62402:71-313(+)
MTVKSESNHHDALAPPHNSYRAVPCVTSAVAGESPGYTNARRPASLMSREREMCTETFVAARAQALYGTDEWCRQMRTLP